MSDKVFILAFPNQNFDEFKANVSETFVGCSRCGRKNNYTNDNISKILNQLQHVAGKNNLPYPIDIKYEFEATESKEVEVKHVFSKNTTTTKEYGYVKLYLHFDTDLNDKEYETWSTICVGVFATLKAI